MQFIRHQVAAKFYIPLGMNAGGGNKGFVLKWQISFRALGGQSA